MKNFLILFSLMLLFSCNQEKLKFMENKVLELEDSLASKDKLIQDQRIEILKLHNRILGFDKKENNIKRYLDSEIIEIVKKDREYYCPKGRRKNFTVRKVNNNIYDVRFDLKIIDNYHTNEWSTSVYRITFLPKDQYKLKLQMGALCI